MERRGIKTCTIIGAGNVATHLAKGLAKYCEIRQVYSRDMNNACKLVSALPTETQPIDDLKSLQPGADLYLVSVTDDAITEIVSATDWIDDGIWAHTSGSVPIDVFVGHKTRYGVFYPLQTFSRDKQIDLSEVPFLIEGSSEDVAADLTACASRFSNDVKSVDSEGRRRLHVAAVFACNFANYMWTQADALLKDVGLGISSLRPLLRETLSKLDSISPEEGQTGPARRGDFTTINKHLAMLDNEQSAIYNLLSNQIYNHYHPDEQNRL